jgi:uncharacterized protein (TIGR02246 family)
MRNTISLIGLFVLAGTGLVMAGGASTSEQGAAPAQPLSGRPDEKPIRDAVEGFQKLYSGGDAAALAGLFVDDATVVDPDGKATKGKAAVAQMYTDAFKESPGLKLEAKVDEVRFLTAEVARVEGHSKLSSTTGAADDDFTKFSALLVQRDGGWRIAEIREYAAPAADIAPYERLRDLEWMVGDWIDESDNNRVRSTVRWADNKSFLIRTYKVDIPGQAGSSGTMIIGWDPQSGQIKSWLFDSNGGHGDGLWTQTGEKEWVVKAQGVLLDGRPTSATQIHTIINKDSVKTSSIDRIIGGQVAPDILDIVMVRQAPQPGAANPKPAGAPVEAPK